MKNLFKNFIPFVYSFISDFFAFALVIKTFLVNVFNYFLAYVSSFGKFFSNFEFIFFVVLLQIFFYFHLLAGSYIDFTNEAIWFFSLLLVTLTLLAYFNSSSQEKSLNSVELKIKQIEDQLSINFQINQEISDYSQNFINFNNSACFQIFNLHVIISQFFNNFSNFDNLIAQFNFILNESFTKQFSYFLRSLDFKEDHVMLITINDLLQEIISEDELAYFLYKYV